MFISKLNINSGIIVKINRWTQFQILKYQLFWVKKIKRLKRLNGVFRFIVENGVKGIIKIIKQNKMD